MPRRAGPVDFGIFLSTLVLLAMGIVMVFSSSAVTSAYSMGDAFYYLKRQLTWAGLGLVGMVALMGFPYSHWRRLAAPLLGISVFLLILVLMIGITAKGSSRWLGVGSLSFQPSELMKLTMVIFLAASLADNNRGLGDSFVRGLGPYLLLIGGVCGLILAQPDLGTAVALAGSTYLMLAAGGANRNHLMILFLGGLALVVAAIALAPYRMARFTAFLNPWADPQGHGYQTIQSLLALGSGGAFGSGLGQGRQKLYYVPEKHTDFIMAILGEELGFVGAALVVTAFFIFLWRGFRTALNAPDAFGSLLAAGITTMVVLQALINMGVVTGLLPVTGITLPLVSYGGSSLIFTLAGIGILLNVSRYAHN
ncbi:MAG: putative lipid II flippase FtsW [Thermoanaerobacteraceae bacterium]|uniref:putative lipid II flippase FtsW n=1 Tax=Thermanaeromonas sp. C210 TaxID=2731925 RepID=UPI00155D241B|nr:putative lipid II flippase FtsW [Thermanaeromonas sp. C210]MBE3581055.1 putative lipid II flippase FtsW [Thermoanaerobacteraceae bacterium]GFN24077.1 cell division protein FtsW [Thermanaeromonas sp. C210]